MAAASAKAIASQAVPGMTSFHDEMIAGCEVFNGSCCGFFGFGGGSRHRAFEFMMQA